MKKVLIIGRSGSGKDALAIALTNKYGMKQLCSTTTRPKRYENENTHIFVSEEEANLMTERVAETFINGYQYFATKQQYIDCDAYVIDPYGMKRLCENTPEIPCIVVYVNVDREIRKERAMLRDSISSDKFDLSIFSIGIWTYPFSSVLNASRHIMQLSQILPGSRSQYKSSSLIS